jgi:uncharacterized membrane protein
MKKMFAEYRALAEADKERELNDAERQRFDYLQERAAVLQLAVMTGLVSFVASAIVSVHQSFLESLSVGGVSAVLIGMMLVPKKTTKRLLSAHAQPREGKASNP